MENLAADILLGSEGRFFFQLMKFSILYYLSLVTVDNCLFDQMLEKFAEDDRIEQMNAQKRRMKQLEHKRAVERLIEERRLQFQRERVRPVLFVCPDLLTD